MSLLVCFVFSVFLGILAKSCEGKPVQYNGYPEENRNVHMPYSSELFEGDMLVGSKVKEIALAGGDVSMANTRKRGATSLFTWPNGVIPYVIDSSVNAAHKTAIESAMKEWENGSCISFVPFISGSADAYLKIMSTLPGCFAAVGYRDVSAYPSNYLPFAIPLNLGAWSGCYSRRLILHELGHSIGFYHEQSRPDRDDYVEILYENIMAGRKSDFSKYTTSIMNSLGDYDFKSVMHYGPKTFTKSPDKFTIKPLDPNIVLTSNEDISVLDKQQLNKLYNCI